MASWPFTDERLRAMYAGGRGDAVARRFSRFWAAVFAAGLCPQRWVTLEVAGRRSGRTGRFPLGMADWQGSWYLVPMLGEDCNWVRNVRAAGGRATLRHRKATACRLVELPPGERAPVLKRYLEQVPGARPHIPVDRHAPLAQFEEIAASYPVFRVEGVEAAEGRPRRVHRWRRRILAIVAILVVLVVAAVVLAVKLQPIPAALRLPTAAPATPIGSVEGTWRVGSGSVAGYRVRETFFGLGNFAVGRTTDVEGTLRVAGDVVTSAVFRIDLATITAGGHPQSQLATSLATTTYPDATFRLTEPMRLSTGFVSGATMTAVATGDLDMRGMSRPVSVAISGRRDGDRIQAVGTIPVVFADWGIQAPAGFGWFGSLAGRGAAEFFVVLERQ